jgi:hypothetical protein
MIFGFFQLTTSGLIVLLKFFHLEKEKRLKTGASS